MIGEIEQAIIQRVKDNLGYLRQVESYGGQFDDELEVWVRAFPACWVTYLGSAKPVRLGAFKYKFTARYATMVGVHNARSEAATRLGDGTVPGAYQVLDEVRLVLMGEDLGLAISPLLPLAAKTLFNTRTKAQAIAVFSQEWECEYVVTARGGLPLTDDWLRAGLNYHLIPDDGKADASDVITLR